MSAKSEYGDDLAYQRLHKWVEKQLGKPKLCVVCGEDNPEKRYHWANLSQEYKQDVSDWRRLCVPCHKRENNPGHCKRWHEITPENTYLMKNGGQECLTCKRELRKQQWQKDKLRRRTTIMEDTTQWKRHWYDKETGDCYRCGINRKDRQ